MTFTMWMIVPALASLLAAVAEQAPETRTTVVGAPAAKSELSDLTWLAGTWEGTGIDGGAATEVYTAPAGGQIVGHFRQLRPDGSVMFYELMTIAQVGNTLHYRLKHFDVDLTGWEEKTEVRSFPLIATGRDTWFFDGLTIRREGASGMVATVRVGNADGTNQELAFRYRRVSS